MKLTLRLTTNYLKESILPKFFIRMFWPWWNLSVIIYVLLPFHTSNDIKLQAHRTPTNCTSSLVMYWKQNFHTSIVVLLIFRIKSHLHLSSNFYSIVHFSGMWGVIWLYLIILSDKNIGAGQLRIFSVVQTMVVNSNIKYRSLSITPVWERERGKYVQCRSCWLLLEL